MVFTQYFIEEKLTMNIENFSEWLHRQGYQVIRTASSCWYNAGPRVLQAFPFDWLIQPSEQELRELTLGKNYLAVRYSTPFDAPDGMVSYHVVLNNPYDIEMLRSQARNGIRRGLENCRVERIGCERMAKEGWILQQDTLERQGRSSSMKQNEWERICSSAADLPGFEVWAALVGDELAATILTARIDDTFYVPYAQCYNKFMCLHANNALFYVASRDMLSRDGVKRIFFSLHSLDAPASVNDFKFRMGMIAKPVRQKIVFHPLLQPFANDLTYRSLKKWTVRDPENSFLAKTEGMLRFYLQGRRPLAEQDWPECLDTYKANVLGMPIIEQSGRDSHVRIRAEN
jgi:hypothetical protein